MDTSVDGSWPLSLADPSKDRPALGGRSFYGAFLRILMGMFVDLRVVPRMRMVVRTVLPFMRVFVHMGITLMLVFMAVLM